MLFLHLPIEILPEILSHIDNFQHLATLCLVNNTFRAFAVCKLYKKVSICCRHKVRKTNVLKLFDTLSDYPHLALLVQRLDVKDFSETPVAYFDDDLLRHVLNGLKNCANLRSCMWTEGSLNSDILKALHQCKNLRSLDLNGSARCYDPQLLSRFTELRRLSLFMLSVPVVRQLKPWLLATGATLRSLVLCCEEPDILTDETLEAIGPSLVNLEHLNLTACPKVTHHGVWAMVSSSRNGILRLALEDFSYNFDIAAFANLCISYGAFRRLRSFWLITYRVYLMDWMKHIVHLLSDSPLELFHVYSDGISLDLPVKDELWAQLILTHRKHLVRISVHPTVISWEAIHNICVQCTKLELLRIVVDPDSLDKLGSCLPLAKAMKTIYINYPRVFGKNFPVLTESQALSILSKCSPTITQFRCDAQAWEVLRGKEGNGESSMGAHITLVPKKRKAPIFPDLE